MTASLDLVILAVDDLPRAVAFYRAGLAWAVEVESPSYVELRGEGARLGLYARSGFARNTGEAPVGRPAAGTTATEVYVRSPEPEAVLARLVAAGARTLSPLARRDWGEDVGYVKDPEGNVVAVARRAPPGRALTVVTLGVRDLSRAATFYRGLGWASAEPPTEGVTFFHLAGGLVLALWGRADLARDAGVPDEGEGFRASSLAINVRAPAEVDALVARAASLGARVVKPPQATFWGGYAGYFEDLDGHLWEVAHNPFWTLDDEGRVTRLAPP